MDDPTVGKPSNPYLWWIEDLRHRLTHPYWRHRRVDPGPNRLVPTISPGGKLEMTSSRIPFRYVRESLVLDRFRREGVRTVLDVGCGTGNTLRHLEGHGFEVDGITINPEESRLADHRRIYLVDIQEDLAATPLADATFDAVISFDCLEHLVNPLAGLWNINRVLRPGGLLIAYIPAARWTECDYHVIVYTPRQFRWLLNLAGFDLERKVGRSWLTGKGITYIARKIRSDGSLYPGVLE